MNRAGAGGAGQGVVLIDFDPQSTRHRQLLLRDKAKVGINDLLRKETFVEDAITPTAFDGLSMIVGARKLYALEHALDSRGGSQQGAAQGAAFLAQPAGLCRHRLPAGAGPSGGRRAGGVGPADRAGVSGRYALDGLRRTLQVVEHIQNGLNPSLTLAGILMLSITNDEVGRNR
ncbi:ParA family protein [Azospirillum sp. B2RO_4]|uniref:ParA family protein n=1 Tax=Azospirillum sp. B2RO_4 TaxID=3027796 RepID=UPI003DA8522C